MKKNSKNQIIKKKEYSQLVNSIGELLESARKEVVITINNILVKTYWKVEKRIVEYERKGKNRADYGEDLLKKLSRDLRLKYGKGFSRSNLQYMRLLYIKYPKCQTLSGKLSWNDYVEILSVSDDLTRSFYEKQCVEENWSVRELRRQYNTDF